MTLPIAVCTLIIHPETMKILGTSRKYDHSRFGFPGGKVDEGEKEKEAASRELKEETGLSINPKDLVFLYRSICNGDRSRPNCQDYDCVTFFAPYHKITGAINPDTGEGLVEWLEWEDFQNGPFSRYNQEVQKCLEGNS